MANSVTTACALILHISFCVSDALANEGEAGDKQSEEIVFIPPADGAPADRLGAGTREGVSSPDKTILLSPADGGVSASAKPLLIWFFSEPVNGPVTVAVRTMGGSSNWFSASIEGRFAPGFHGLNLARSQVELAPGRLYRWEVQHGDARTSAARGLIEYRPQHTTPTSARKAAAAGLWHDALALLFDVDFSGRLKLKDAAALKALTKSGGLDLTNIFEAQE